MFPIGHLKIQDDVHFFQDSYYSASKNRSHNWIQLVELNDRGVFLHVLYRLFKIAAILYVTFGFGPSSEISRFEWSWCPFEYLQAAGIISHGFVADWKLKAKSEKTSDAECLIRDGFGIFGKPSGIIRDVREPIDINSTSSESLLRGFVII